MLFPPDFLTRLEYLSMMSKRVFRGRLLAQRRSLQTGAGLEFSDHREYAPGEDLRYLDWNIYARHGQMLVKRFQEEQDLQVSILLDASRSMSFGSPSKFDRARQLAAAFAWLALADLDRAGISVFADGLVQELPGGRGRERILGLMRFLESLSAAGQGTRFTRATQDFLQRAPRPGLAIVLSDLLDPAGISEGLDQLRYRRYDLHVVQLFAPQDAHPELLGDVELEDLETGEMRQVRVTERVAAEYRRAFLQHQHVVRSYCRRYGFRWTAADSSVPYDQLMLQMMKVAGMESGGEPDSLGDLAERPR
ncbi:MAG: DUF58 domain-containing protein [Planctomycetota bacterium]